MRYKNKKINIIIHCRKKLSANNRFCRVLHNILSKIEDIFFFLTFSFGVEKQFYNMSNNKPI